MAFLSLLDGSKIFLISINALEYRQKPIKLKTFASLVLFNTLTAPLEDNIVSKQNTAFCLNVIANLKLSCISFSILLLLFFK